MQLPHLLWQPSPLLSKLDLLHYLHPVLFSWWVVPLGAQRWVWWCRPALVHQCLQSRYPRQDLLQRLFHHLLVWGRRRSSRRCCSGRCRSTGRSAGCCSRPAVGRFPRFCWIACHQVIVNQTALGPPAEVLTLTPSFLRIWNLVDLDNYCACVLPLCAYPGIGCGPSIGWAHPYQLRAVLVINRV